MSDLAQVTISQGQTGPDKPATAGDQQQQTPVTTSGSVTGVATATATSKETAQNASDRPSWLPEKFKSAEDMAKAYGELEKKLGTGGAQQPQQQKPATAGDQQQPQEQTQQTPTLDLSKFNKELGEKGALSNESYTELAKLGYDKNTVDTYIAGQKALAAQRVGDIHGSVGGKDVYTGMVQWASANLEPAEVEAFNKSVTSGSIAEAKLAAQGLLQRFTDANGKAPKLLEGTNGATAVDVYRSTAEVTQAMRDPRYGKDRAYTKDVEEKVKRSGVFKKK